MPAYGPIIPLEYPWALCEEPRPMVIGASITLPAAAMPALALPVGHRLQYLRRPHQPCPTDNLLQWGEHRLQVWTLPTGSASGDEAIDARVYDSQGATIGVPLRITNHLGRYDREGLGGPLNERALDREMLIGVIVDLIAALTNLDRVEVAAQGMMRGWVRGDWLRVAEVLRGERDADEPRMALIVHHARTLHRLVEELGRHPRRVLTRNRRLQPVHRIQEMDSACLSWYVRQPGRTSVEKAGSRQALLAVVREETIDTPENRVLRDFFTRTVQTAEGYLAANRNLSNATRYGEVSRYARACGALLRRPEFAQVRSLVGVAQPNYVLTSDPRYRRIWDAYQALLRRQNEVDEAWTWQTRLWGDLVTMAVMAALLSSTAEPVAMSPVYLRREQDRGRWLAVKGCTGVFSTPKQVLMVYAADSAPPQLQARYGLLAPHLIIRAEPFGDGRHRDTLIWAIAGAGAESLMLGEVTGRAGHVIDTWHRDPTRPFRDHSRIRGLLVVPPEQWHAALLTAAHGDATGIALPLDGRGFTAGLELIGNAIINGRSA